MISLQAPNLISFLFTGLAIFVSSFIIITFLAKFFPDDQNEEQEMDQK